MPCSGCRVSLQSFLLHPSAIRVASLPLERVLCVAALTFPLVGRPALKFPDATDQIDLARLGYRDHSVLLAAERQGVMLR